MRKIDHTGQRYGRLTVLHECAREGRTHPRWSCQCDCGTQINATGYLLSAGRVRSCGCLQRDAASKYNSATKVKHSGFGTRLYSTWQSMIQRCCNPKSPAYRHYGGRGIEVCASWVNDFAAFRRDMGDKPTHDHSLDRKDNDGPYSPENCRWATREQQARNKRRSLMVEHNGKLMHLKDACEASGVNYATARYRMSAGKPWNRGGRVANY